MYDLSIFKHNPELQNLLYIWLREHTFRETGFKFNENNIIYFVNSFDGTPPPKKYYYMKHIVDQIIKLQRKIKNPNLRKYSKYKNLERENYRLHNIIKNHRKKLEDILKVLE